MTGHRSLAAALLDRVIARTRTRGQFRGAKLIGRRRYRNQKQKQLYTAAIYSTLFPTAGKLGS